MMFFNFLNFILFFWNFLNQVRSERTLNQFFSPLSRPILAWNIAGMVFFIYLFYFYTIFLKFSKPGWVGTDSKSEIFLFFLIVSLPVPFWLEIKLEWFFLTLVRTLNQFLIFILFFGNFLTLVRLERTRKDFFFFFFSFSASPFAFWLEIMSEW